MQCRKIGGTSIFAVHLSMLVMCCSLSIFLFFYAVMTGKHKDAQWLPQREIQGGTKIHQLCFAMYVRRQTVAMSSVPMHNNRGPKWNVLVWLVSKVLSKQGQHCQGMGCVEHRVSEKHSNSKSGVLHTSGRFFVSVKTLISPVQTLYVLIVSLPEIRIDFQHPCPFALFRFCRDITSNTLYLLGLCQVWTWVLSANFQP